MSRQRRTRTIPCEQCRDKHVKCDGDIPCGGCSAAGVDCRPRSKQLRFKWFNGPSKPSSPQQHTQTTKSRRKNEVGAGRSRTGNPSTPDREDASTQVAAEPLQQASPSESYDDESVIETPSAEITRAAPIADARGRGSSKDSHCSMSFLLNHDFEAQQADYQAEAIDPNLGSDLPFADETACATSTPDTIGFSSLFRELDERIPLSPSQTQWDNDYIPRRGGTSSNLSIQEACLVRCFAERIASAFDTTDRAAHYGNVVPLRALQSPLLLNAVCTASARYLMRLNSAKGSSSTVEYSGVSLPELTEEAIIRYQSTSISHLISASQDPNHISSDDTLVAITILRYHEQVDVQLTGSDHEVFARAVRSTFQGHESRGDGFRGITVIPPITTSPFAISHPSLRNSAFLIALRQEIWSVLLYRRPFQLPIASLREYPKFDEMHAADDYEWSNCIILWCAHVLKLCFGSVTGVLDPDHDLSRAELWATLKAFEYEWDTRPPACFTPLRFQERHPEKSEYFPQIWQANICQVMGLQHIEFGRIVLAGYESRLFREKVGLDNASKTLEALFRQSTRIICGLGSSHKNRQEPLVNTAVAVSMCGKFFSNPREQGAIMDLIKILETDHAWYVNQAIQSLQMPEALTKGLSL